MPGDPLARHRGSRCSCWSRSCRSARGWRGRCAPATPGASRRGAAPSRRRRAACAAVASRRQPGRPRAGARRRSARPSARSPAASARRSRPASNLGRKIIDAPENSVTLVATKSPWVWKIGSAWISTSSAVKRQVSIRARAFETRLPWRQHRALGAAGRARGVEEGGEVVGRRAPPSRRPRAPPRPRRSACPRPSAPSVTSLRARLVGGRLAALARPGRVADEDRRLGVADEILDLRRACSRC